MAEPLKLRASDADDIAVVAAVLQDALVPIGEMAFLLQDRRFVMVANRFRWESHDPAALPEGGGVPQANAPQANAPQAEAPQDASYQDSGGPPFERINCGVSFESVTAVRTKGIDLRDRGRILDLLTLRPEPGALLLVFAGGATIRLEQAEPICFLEDIGEAWPTRSRPAHALDEEPPQ